MNIQAIKKPINQFYKNLSSRIQVDSIVIFGSRSKGKERNDSDVDVIVVSNDFKSMRSDRRLKILDTASINISPEIQAWGFTKDEFDSAGELSTVGYTRSKGYKII